MKDRYKVKVSRYMSYLLRHNPENLKMDAEGFVGFKELLEKVREHFRVSREFIIEIVEESDRKRFELVEDKIRALYGHTIPVELEFEEEKLIKILYHGTTPEAASEILGKGLKPMKRRWVHLSPSIETAKLVGLRRTDKPVILQIDVEKARKDHVKFYKATENVYLCRHIEPEHITRTLHV